MNNIPAAAKPSAPPPPMVQVKREACDFLPRTSKSTLVYACRQCNIYFPIRRMLELHDCCYKSVVEPVDEVKPASHDDDNDDDDDENSWHVETLDENLLLLKEHCKGQEPKGSAELRRNCPYCSFSCDNSSTYRSHVKRKHDECWLKLRGKENLQGKRDSRQAAVTIKSAASSRDSKKPDAVTAAAAVAAVGTKRRPHRFFETRTKSTLYSRVSRTHKIGRVSGSDETTATTNVQQPRRRRGGGGGGGGNAFSYTGYACNYCTFAAATMLSLKYHTAREHGAAGTEQIRQPVIEFPVQEFDCDQCSDYKTKSRKAMQHHLKAHRSRQVLRPNDEGLFSCHLCFFESTSKMGVQRHISIKHDKPRRERSLQASQVEAFACEACDYRTYNAKLFEWHVKRQHDDEPLLAGDQGGEGQDCNDYLCNDCDFVTWTKAQLLTHIKRNHAAAGRDAQATGGKIATDKSANAKGRPLLLQCDHCEYTTKNKHVMKVHVIRKHTEGFNHACELCGKKYKVKADLTNHMRFQHREQPIICDVCGKECRNSNLLYLHQKFAHYKPEFECQICRRRMVSQANLTEHVLKQHEQRQSVMCEECGKTFTRQSRLKIHMRTHLGLRPYTCKICGKSFARRNGLRQHLLIHTGQRPYVCDICGKDFTQKTGLISHRKSHPGSHPPLPRITIDHVLSSLPNV